MRFTGGLPETACGWGSTLAATEGLRKELPGLLERLGARVLLDAPCGDLNWMSQVQLGEISCIGVDREGDHLRRAGDRRPDWDFCWVDILTGPLPTGQDTILCRDFLQHLPDHLVLQVLANFAATGARWLLATSHDVAINRDIETVGDFRPLNLQAAPFDLGPPVEAIPDCDGRILGVWAL